MASGRVYNVGLSAISLFSGAGGLDLAAKWAGIRTVCYVEYDKGCQANLISRMWDGLLDEAKIWDDIKTFDGKPWRGGLTLSSAASHVNLTPLPAINGGGQIRETFGPIQCESLEKLDQDSSLEKMSPGIIHTGYIYHVLADLEAAGFNAIPYSVHSCAFSAAHSRERVFIVGDTNGFRRFELDQDEANRCSKIYFNLPSERFDKPHEIPTSMDLLRATPSSGVCRVDHELATGVDRLKRIGNGIDPRVAYTFFREINK